MKLNIDTKQKLKEIIQKSVAFHIENQPLESTSNFHRCISILQALGYRTSTLHPVANAHLNGFVSKHLWVKAFSRKQPDDRDIWLEIPLEVAEKMLVFNYLPKL